MLNKPFPSPLTLKTNWYSTLEGLLHILIGNVVRMHQSCSEMTRTNDHLCSGLKKHDLAWWLDTFTLSRTICYLGLFILPLLHFNFSKMWEVSQVVSCDTEPVKKELFITHSHTKASKCSSHWISRNKNFIGKASWLPDTWVGIIME